MLGLVRSGPVGYVKVRIWYTTTRRKTVSEDAKLIIRALIRGLKFTVSLMEKLLRGEKI